MPAMRLRLRLRLRFKASRAGPAPTRTQARRKRRGIGPEEIEYFLETVESDGVRLASTDEIERRAAGENAALIACGQTHHPRAVRRAGGQLIVNPGSVGLPAFATDRPTPHVVRTGSPDARYAIVERTTDSLVKFSAAGRDTLTGFYSH